MQDKTHPLIMVVLGLMLAVLLGIAGTVYAAFERNTLPTLLVALPYLAVGAVGYWAFKRERIRGLGYGLLLLGGYVLLLGTVEVIDDLLRYPGIPAVVPPLLGLIYGAVLGGVRLKELAWAGGAALGVLCGIGYAAVGMLGLEVEALTAVMQALSLGLIGAAFVKAARFEQKLASVMTTGLVLSAAFPTLFAVYGFGFPALLLGVSLLLAGFAAAATDDDALAFGFLTGAALLPLLLTEALELRFGIGVPHQVWAVLAMIGLCGLLAVVLLFVEEIPHPVVLGSMGVAMVAVPLVYVISGGQWFQPHSYLVVMADQPDTSAARSIEDYNQRRQTVYDDLTAFAAGDQAAVRGLIAGVDHTPYYIVNAIEVRGGGPLLRLQLTTHPDVDRVLTSPRPRPRRQPPIPQPIQAEAYSGSIPWGIEAIRAPQVWADLEVQGEGIIVGSADSGVAWQHPALTGSYLGAEGSHDYTWFDPWFGTDAPVDAGSHGTHTLGTVVGGFGIGAAPGAQWMACSNLSYNLGNPAYYMGCMQFLFAPHPLEGDPFTEGIPARGAHVVNNSWGCPPEEGCDNRTLAQAVGHLADGGQMMVISAGNEGPRCETIYAVALAPEGVTVGAVDEANSVTRFSSRGEGDDRPWLDVVAPGANVLSSVPSGYAAFQGTSMAGPHVAGTVVLMWSANPDLIGQIETTEDILRQTARPVSVAETTCGQAAGWDQAGGYGLIDAFAAVQAALAEE